MQKPIPTSTLIRFPLLFGTFLIAGGFAFVYRKEILGDVDKERENLCKNNAEGKLMIEEVKMKHAKLM